MAFIRPAFAIAAARSYLFSSPISFSSSSSAFRDNERRPKRKELTLPSTTESRKAGTDCDQEKEKNMKTIDANGRSAVNDRAIKLAKFINGARHFLFNGLTHQLWVGKQFSTKAMEAGTARHKQLADEVVQRIEGKCESKEDKWALNFVNIIVSINQLLDKGLTRECRVIAFVRGVWMTGFIDEIRLSDGEKPKLIDYKTREENTLPVPVHMSKGWLQLMIYKFLWDKLVSEEFPLGEFCAFYEVDPDKFLSEEIRTKIAKAGVPAQNLGEVIRCMEERCKVLLPADDEMILRYEWQKDNSLIKEVEVKFDPVFFMTHVDRNLAFWCDGEKPS